MSFPTAEPAPEPTGQAGEPAFDPASASAEQPADRHAAARHVDAELFDTDGVQPCFQAFVGARNLQCADHAHRGRFADVEQRAARRLPGHVLARTHRRCGSRR